MKKLCVSRRLFWGFLGSFVSPGTIFINITVIFEFRVFSTNFKGMCKLVSVSVYPAAGFFAG